MLIEKRFFDIAKREDEEIKRELEAEKAKMTEEEKLEEKKQHEAEVKEIIRKAEVVAQSSVANGAVQHADVFAEGHQIAFLWCHCSSPFPFAVTLVD